MSDLKDRMLAPRIPDLTKPSLEALAYLLRHRELWPNGFYWCFTREANCAIGLGRKFWGKSPHKQMGLWSRCWTFWYGNSFKSPGKVADEIDAYLSKLSK